MDQFKFWVDWRGDPDPLLVVEQALIDLENSAKHLKSYLLHHSNTEYTYKKLEMFSLKSILLQCVRLNCEAMNLKIVLDLYAKSLQ